MIGYRGDGQNRKDVKDIKDTVDTEDKEDMGACSSYGRRSGYGGQGSEYGR